MTLQAIWTETNDPILLTVVPYGLFVERNGHRDYELETKLIKQAQSLLTDTLRKELEDYGEERPEGYVYYYAALHQFYGQIQYPGIQICSLYPGDFTFKRIDIVGC